MGNHKNHVLPALICLGLCLAGCMGALQRGMLGEAYVSTARPAIMIQAKDMPLMLAGEGGARLDWTSMAGGLPIDVWLAVYGTGGLAPFAVIAQASVPSGWNWDASLLPPFSVDIGTETFNGVTYQACTFIVNPERNPFGSLITGTLPDGQPQLWLARYCAARFNNDKTKIILQYMEPLPAEITSLTELPLGYMDLLPGFEQRARETFAISTPPADAAGIQTTWTNAIAWQYMGQRFLGSASPIDMMRAF